MRDVLLDVASASEVFVVRLLLPGGEQLAQEQWAWPPEDGSGFEPPVLPELISRHLLTLRGQSPLRLWIHGPGRAVALRWEEMLIDAWPGHPGAPVSLDEQTQIWRWTLDVESWPPWQRLLPGGRLGVLVLSSPLHPHHRGRAIPGIQEAAVLARRMLGQLRREGRATVWHVPLEKVELDDGLAKVEGPVHLLIYLGFCERDREGEGMSVAVSGRHGQMLPLVDLLARIRAATGEDTRAVIATSSPDAGGLDTGEGDRAPLAACALGDLSGAPLEAQIRGFCQGLVQGQGFFQACQQGHLEVIKAGEEGEPVGPPVLTSRVMEDRLCPSPGEVALAEYRRHLQDTFDHLPGPGGPRPLDELYQELPLLVGNPGDAARVRLEERLGQARGILLVADAGCGKTTLLQATARRVAAANSREVPLYLHLGRWPTLDQDVVDLCEAAIREIAGPPGPADTQQQQQQQQHHQLTEALHEEVAAGRALLLVDGVDEAPPERLLQMIRALEQATSRSGEPSRLVVASRPSEQVELLRRHLPLGAPCPLALLEPAQVQALALACLDGEGEDQQGKAKEFVAAVRRYPESWEMARNPFLLRAMAFLHAQGRLLFPTSMRALYEILVVYLIQQRARPRGPGPVDRVTEELRDALTLVAGLMTDKQQSTVRIEDVEALVELRRLGPADAALEALADSGLMIRVSPDQLCFPHRSLQDYFAGRWLASLVHDDGDLDHLRAWITKHVHDGSEGWHDARYHDVIGWAGAHLPPHVVQRLSNWLCEDDDALFGGTIMAARLLALAEDEAFERAWPRLNERLRELLGSPASEEILATARSRGSLRSFQSRRADFLGASRAGEDLQFLRSEDPVVAGAEGMESDEELFWAAPLEGLSSADAITRAESVRTLSRLQDGFVVPHIVPLLEDPEAPVRVAAAHALGELGARQLHEEVTALLEDPQPPVRRAALEALVAMEAREAAARIVSSLDDPDRAVRSAAAMALGALGDGRVIPSIVPMLEDADVEVSSAAAEALMSLERQGDVIKVMGQHQQSNTTPQSATARVLAALGRREGTAPIVPLLHDPQAAVRQAAVEAICSAGGIAAAGDLIPSLQDADVAVRLATLQALVRLEADEAIPQIVPLLEDPRGAVRAAAVGALSDLGAAAEMSGVVQLFTDPNDSVRAAAAQAMGGLSPGDAEETLARLLHDPAGQVRGAAVQALGQLGAHGTAPQLGQLLEDPQPLVRVAAARALWDLGQPVDAACLVVLLTDSDESVRAAAAEALVLLDAPETREAVIPLLKHDRDEVRAVAVQILSRFSGHTPGAL